MQSEEGGEEPKRTVFIMLEHYIGVMAYSFYSIDIPNAKGQGNPLPHPFYSPPAKPQEGEGKPPLLPLDPLFALPHLEYPRGMQVVELGSKLYFLGGQLVEENSCCTDEKWEENQLIEGSKRPKWKWMMRLSSKSYDYSSFPDPLFPHPRNVYIFDPNKLKSNSKSTTTTCDPLEFLTQGTPMNYGKPRPQVFVAHGKIYALGSNCSHLYYEEDIPPSHFECFDPRVDKWTSLAEPPYGPGFLSGHVVVRNKVFIMVHGYHLYCYDLDNDQWLSSVCESGLVEMLFNKSEFMDNRVYSSFNQAAFVSHELGEGEGESVIVGRQLFSVERLLGISPPDDVMYFYDHQVSISKESNCTIPLGNRRVCYVSTAQSAENLEYPPYDDYTRYISVTIAEACEDIKDDRAFIRLKCLHSAHFVVTTPWSSVGCIWDYCSILSTDTVANVEEMEQVMLSIDDGVTV